VYGIVNLCDGSNDLGLERGKRRDNFDKFDLLRYMVVYSLIGAPQRN
jgi:hypothetical protein